MAFGKPPTDSGHIETLIGPGSRLEGHITAEGMVRLDGQLVGNLSCEGVIIGEKAEVQGDIAVKTAVVGGRVNGNIKASQSLELLARCQVKGDIESAQLLIQEGAVYNGHCRMSALTETEDTSS